MAGSLTPHLLDASLERLNAQAADGTRYTVESGPEENTQPIDLAASTNPRPGAARIRSRNAASSSAIGGGDGCHLSVSYPRGRIGSGVPAGRQP